MTPPAKRLPAEPVYRHIRKLRAEGITVRRIAATSGLPLPTVAAVSKNQRHWILEHNATAILAVTADAVAPRAGYLFATRSRRQIQALMRIGYTQIDLRARADMAHASMVRLVTGRNPCISVRAAASIDRVYRTLAWTPGPSSRSAAMAQRKGWASPAAWDDDTIGDPKAKPDYGPKAVASIDEHVVRLACAGDRRIAAAPRKAERREAVRRLTAAGWSAEEIADLFDTTDRAIVRDRGVNARRELMAA